MGDAADPWIKGNKIIAHVCNDVGGWGRGFVLSLRERWPLSEQQYRRWYVEQHNMPGMEDNPMLLGHVQFVLVNHKTEQLTQTSEFTIVANMIAQHDVRPAPDGTPPIRYEALAQCLKKVAEMAEHYHGASIHMPRIGCGLAGGKWSEVEKLIEQELNDFHVYVYDLDFDASDKSSVRWNK